jgi:hypothetical protein
LLPLALAVDAGLAVAAIVIVAAPVARAPPGLAGGPGNAMIVGAKKIDGEGSEAGWPDWAIFRLMDDFFLREVF